MSCEFLTGVGVALITPFDENNQIDWLSLEKTINHLIDGNTAYIVIVGTTGESVTLSKSEKSQLIKKTTEICKNRVPVVLGIGGNDTAQVIADINSFDLSEIAAILSVSPAYNKPTQEGIIAHYSAIAESTSLPIILYNVPGRTSSNMTAETTLFLARNFKNIVAIKEATYDFEQITDLVLGKPDDFYLVSGCDDLIFHQMALGFDGVISVAAHAFPKEFSEMIQLCQNNDFHAAAKIHLDLYKFIWLIFKQGNPAGIKAALKHLNLCEENVRLPLVQVNDDLREKIGEEMAKLATLALR